MIRKLNENDREQSMLFLQEKPAENLFIIGDIEAFGFDKDFQDLWGEFDEEGKLKAIVLRYRDNYIIYASGEFDALTIARLIENDKQTSIMISGISLIVNQVIAHISTRPVKTRELFYAKCETLKKLNTPKIEIKKATVNEVPKIVRLYDQIPEFDSRENREEGLIKSMEQGVSRCYYIEKDNEIVSTAMTAAENSMSAMLVGVATHPTQTKKGYASACLMKLCSELLEENKYLCLFYDNPAAGTIYKKLGFVDIDKWVMNTY